MLKGHHHPGAPKMLLESETEILGKRSWTDLATLEYKSSLLKDAAEVAQKGCGLLSACA